MWTNKIVTACALMLAVSNCLESSYQIQMGTASGNPTGQLYFGTPIQGSGSSYFACDTTQSYTSVAATTCVGCQSKYYNQTSSTSAANSNFGTTSLTWVAPDLTSNTFHGYAIEDRVCLYDSATVCVDQFDFFSIEDGSLGDGGLDGILGLAPGTESLPSYVEALYNEGSIDSPAISFGFDTKSNYLYLGDIDDSMYAGDIYYFENQSTQIWTVSIGKISYGNTDINSEAESALLATAMEGIALTASDYEIFYSQFNSSSNNTFTCDGSLCTSSYECNNYSSLPNLTFVISDYDFSIPPAGYLQSTNVGLSLGCKLNVYSYNQTVFGEGFLQSYFTTFNYTDGLIGFAVSNNSAVGATISLAPVGGFSTWAIVLITISAFFLVAFIVHCINERAKSKKKGSDDRYKSV